MGRSCEWCDAVVSRVWEIPKSQDRKRQWVCKECHMGYFDGELDENGRDADKPDRVV